MKPRVSIVVPIFNMERYLARCLDSLLAQSLPEIEIIAVNDGSTDSTRAILDRYAAADPRVRAIHQPNSGVSAARNTGIQAASGAYIGFVDPDDWVDSAMYQVLYEAAEEEQADIAMCTYVREFGSHSKEKVFPLPGKAVFRGEDVQNRLTRRLVGPMGQELAYPDMLDAWGTVWCKLYRAGMIKDRAIRFTDLSEIGSNEDTLFNIYACYYAQCFVFIGQPLYHYWRANAESITGSYNPGLESRFSQLYAHMERVVSEFKLPRPYPQALSNRICMNALGLGLNVIFQGKQASAAKKIKMIQAILSSSKMKTAFVRFEFKHLPITWRLFYRMAKLRFAAGVYMMLLAIEWMRVRNTRSVRHEAGSNLASSHRYEPRRAGNDDHELLPAARQDQHTI